MSNPTEQEDGVRIKKVIEGENFYFYISDTFICATVPRENDPRMSKVRAAVEATCELINERLSCQSE